MNANPKRKMEDNPTQNLCAGDCGFYGSPATDGFCSLCYKKKKKKKQQQSPVTSSTPVPSSVSTASQTSLSDPKELQSDKKVEENATTEASTSSANPEDNSDANDGKKKKNRCASCRKKVGLTGFDCRCGGLFCSAHRYSDKHDCQFDYKGVAAEEIRRKNPVVVGEKVKKF